MARRRGLTNDPLGDALRKVTPRGLDAIVPGADGEGNGGPRARATQGEPPANLSTDKSFDQLTYQSTGLSTVLSTVESSDQPIRRPVAFYLSERQDETLTVLTEFFRHRYRIKTDRSALLRAILRQPVLDFYDESTHEELIRRLSDDAALRLLGRAGD